MRTAPTLSRLIPGGLLLALLVFCHAPGMAADPSTDPAVSTTGSKTEPNTPPTRPGLWGKSLFSPSLNGETARFSNYHTVTGVAQGDVLNIRQAPDYHAAIVGTIPPWGSCVMYLGQDAEYKGARWVRIQYEGYVGWVNASYLAPARTCE